MSWVVGVVVGLLALCASPAVAARSATPQAKAKAKHKAKKKKAPTGEAGIHKIKHVVIIMQENHSFDNYFGTYPGADGIPGLAGNRGAVPCIPDPKRGHCDRPYHEITVSGSGGPHFNSSAISDIDNGKMDGFAETAEQTGAAGLDTDKAGCAVELQLNCLDVTGYYNQQEIPNYWAYAKNFVLQDHMFEPVLAWSEVSHLYMVSGWSAQCSNSDPFSCTTDITFPELPPSLSNALLQEATGAALGIALPVNPVGEFSWTDITYVLHKYGVPWKYYIQAGTEPDCETGAMTCLPRPQAVTDPSIWNPLPDFDDVKQDNQIGNIAPSSQLFTDAQNGHLPAVSWVVPSGDASEHAPANIEAGQQHVTNVINAIMKSPDWDSTAIFVAWDDWGGYYDHVNPPKVDGEGYGLRVPGLLISPYAKKGYIDHQTVSFDASLKFIEDDFMRGARLDPKADGRPDPRPDVREDEKALGNLLSEFNFRQAPRKPVILNPNPTGQVNLIGPGTVGTAGPNPLTVDPNCPAPSGAVRGQNLGPVTLGTTRAKLRARLSKYSPKANRRFDDFCLLGGQGIRVGYLGGRSVLAMTANPHYAYRNVRAGTRVAPALRRLGRGVSGPLRRGATRWYAVRVAKAVLLLKAQGNTVREIGLASRRRAATVGARRRLLDALRA
ncbi:MAG TPA: alkaline phosphatase family protein [Solirubrobacteraceae bacterium]